MNGHSTVDNVVASEPTPEHDDGCYNQQLMYADDEAIMADLMKTVDQQQPALPGTPPSSFWALPCTPTPTLGKDALVPPSAAALPAVKPLQLAHTNGQGELLPRRSLLATLPNATVVSRN